MLELSLSCLALLLKVAGVGGTRHTTFYSRSTCMLAHWQACTTSALSRSSV